MKKFFPDVVSGYKNNFGKSELDIYLPSKKIGIEYDGCQWHKGKKAYEKEKKKYFLCKDNGIYLIRIKETDKEGDIQSENCDSLYIINVDPADNDLNKLIDTLLKKEFKIEYHSNINEERAAILQTFYNTQYEKSLKKVNPSLAVEWHPTKNGILKPENVPANSGEYAWWKCSACGNEWRAVIASRNAGSGCKRCFDNKRKNGMGIRMSNAEFVKKIESLNLDIEPLEEYVNSSTKILVQCKKCERKWKVFPSSLTVQHSRCGKCYGNLKKTTEEFSTELQKVHSELEVIGEYVNFKLLVINWRKKHPGGSKAKCHYDTHLGMQTISKWWND